MHPDDEKNIERYLRRRDALTPGERQAVERLLAEDAAARAVRDELAAFYAAHDEGDEEDSPALDALMRRVTGVIVLRPVVPPEPVRVRKAALSEPASPPRFQTLTTLIAEDDGVVVRLLWDRASGRGRLFVLAEEEEKRAQAWVSFPKRGLEAVTDATGRAEVPLAPGVQKEDWSAEPVVLHLPLASFTLAPADFVDGTASCGLDDGTVVRVRHEGGMVSVTFQDDDRPMHGAALEWGGKTRLLSLHGPSGRVPMAGLPRALTVRLYP